jgi:hypothetical protein
MSLSPILNVGKFLGWGTEIILLAESNYPQPGLRVLYGIESRFCICI